jgi:L-ascorbate metabolism protein UlaG (beta-lactamase superfamily)
MNHLDLAVSCTNFYARDTQKPDYPLVIPNHADIAIATSRACVNTTKVDVIFVNEGSAFTEEGFFSLHRMDST